MAKRRYVGVKNLYNNDVTYYVITWVYREQWYVIISGHRPSLTDNLLEAGCTNKLCPIPGKVLLHARVLTLICACPIFKANFSHYKFSNANLRHF